MRHRYGIARTPLPDCPLPLQWAFIGWQSVSFSAHLKSLPLLHQWALMARDDAEAAERTPSYASSGKVRHRTLQSLL